MASGGLFVEEGLKRPMPVSFASSSVIVANNSSTPSPSKP